MYRWGLCFLIVAIWHFAMNTGVYLQGWGPTFWATQIMGIPFLIDHWIKLTVGICGYLTLREIRYSWTT